MMPISAKLNPSSGAMYSWATDTFVRDSASLTAVGRLISAVLRALSWPFLAGLLMTNAITNAVGRNAEFQADRRVVAMGFGRPLANALRRVMDTPAAHTSRWERLWWNNSAAPWRQTSASGGRDSILRRRQHRHRRQRRLNLSLSQ